MKIRLADKNFAKYVSAKVRQKFSKIYEFLA